MAKRAKEGGILESLRLAGVAQPFLHPGHLLLLVSARVSLGERHLRAGAQSHFGFSAPKHMRTHARIRSHAHTLTFRALINACVYALIHRHAFQGWVLLLFPCRHSCLLSLWRPRALAASRYLRLLLPSCPLKNITCTMPRQRSTSTGAESSFWRRGEGELCAASSAHAEFVE